MKRISNIFFKHDLIKRNFYFMYLNKNAHKIIIICHYVLSLAASITQLKNI